MLKWEKTKPSCCYFSTLKVHGGRHDLMANAMNTKWENVVFKVHGERHEF